MDAKSMLSVLLRMLCLEASAWCGRTAIKDVSLAGLLTSAMQANKRPRRCDPQIRAMLQQRKAPRTAIRNWQQDGFSVPLGGDSSQFDVCCRYRAEVAKAFADVCTVELAMDAARFGGRDTENIIIYSTDIGKAAYLPPQVALEIRRRLSKIRKDCLR